MLRPPDLDPLAVRRQFTRRIGRMADADFLLRDVEQRLLERLALVRLQPGRVLDVGAGRGHGARALAARYPQAQVVAVDAVPGMLGPAAGAAPAGWRARWRAWFGAPGAARDRGALAPGGGASAPIPVAADAHALPLAASRFELVWSNLALHWFHDPAAVVAEWYRVVAPGGLLTFSALGTDTLRGLLDPTRRGFHDLHDLGDLLAARGFAEPVMDVERITVTWRDPLTALAELHALGGDASRSRPRGLAGRARRRGWLERLEALRGPDGRIAVPFELVFGHAWCPPAKRRADGYQPLPFVRSAGRPGTAGVAGPAPVG